MLVLLSLSFKGLYKIYKSTVLYWISVQPTVLGAAYTISCHPEDDHHCVHHHPAAADGDHSNQGHQQEVEEKSMYTIIYEHQKWKTGVHQ